MAKLKTALQGKKTYIVSGLTVAAVWTDYFFGLGLSDLCTTEPCNITLQQAFNATVTAVLASTLRAGIGSK